MAVYSAESFNLSVDGRPDRVLGALVSWELLGVLGLEPELGRDFTVEDDTEGAPRVAMVSSAYWHNRMDSDLGVIGSTLRIDSEEYIIIGVLPAAAVVPSNAQVWAPLSVLDFCCEPGQNAGSYWLDGVGRLRQGVSIEQAREDLAAVHTGLVDSLGNARTDATPRIEPLRERQVGDTRPILVVLLLRAVPEEVRGWVTLQIHWRLALFAVALAVATALVSGLAPAVMAARTAPQRALRDAGNRRSTGLGQRRALAALAVTEIALAAVLLVGAGLLLDAFRVMTKGDPGYRTDPLTFTRSLPAATYPDSVAQRAFFARVEERIGALSGVESAGWSTIRPLGGHTGYFFDVEDGLERREGDVSPVVLTRYATPSYFDAMGITFLHGAPYGSLAGVEEGPFEVVVNETFARTFWGEIDVVGRRIHTGSDDAAWLPIAGVVRDTQHYGPDTPMRPGVFLPFASSFGGRGTATVALRSAGDPLQLVSAARELTLNLDPDVPLFGIGTMADHLRERTWNWRMYSGLLGAFGGAALLLALGGVYTTFSYVVSQRRMEIGIRLALGARDSQVLREVLRGGMLIAGVGIGVGTLLAFVAAGLVATTLVHASPRNPWLYIAVAFVLGQPPCSRTSCPLAAPLAPTPSPRCEPSELKRRLA